MQKPIQEKITDIIDIALKNTNYAGLALSIDAIEALSYLRATEEKAKALAEEVGRLQAEIDELKKSSINAQEGLAA